MSTQLILLGTAAGPTPKPGRHPPGHAIVVDGCSYLIECANGVARQLLRAEIPLASLRAAFVTHHHIDHAADCATLGLLAWSQLREPLHVVAPPPLSRLMDAFFVGHADEIAERIATEGRQDLRELVCCHEFSEPGVVYTDARVRVTAVRVDHGRLLHAYAFRFDTADRSIVFSGDTAPCDRVADLARGADVLVHEAVYTQALGSSFAGYAAPALLDRLATTHSPVHAAAAIAQRAGVTTLVLSPLAPAQGVSDAAWLAAARPHFSGDIIVGADLDRL